MARRLLTMVNIPDERELAAAGVAWFSHVEDLGKADPAAADRLYAAMWAHLAATRPETPCSLSERIAPTEPPPSHPPRGAG